MGSEFMLRNLDDHDYRMPRRGIDPTKQAEDDILRNLNNAAPKRHQVEQIQRFAGLGIGLSSVFAENLLSHPFIVLRRQCQVNHSSYWYHLTPFTLFPVVYNLHRQQSLLCTWKGIGSTFVVRGIFLASEGAITEFSPCPREVTRHSRLKKVGLHLLMKSLCCMITTPFQAASLVETVQSEVVTDRVNILDTIKEGFWRVYSPEGHWSLLMPVWKLWPVCMLHGVTHYVIKSLVQNAVLRRADFRDEKSAEPSSAVSMQERYYPELMASFSAGLLADVLLFPIETVLHRLLLQGTRSIIDNTDTGLDVLPINTKYEGFIDCANCIARQEGITGFYKGFGALIIQYTIHLALLKFTRFLFEQITAHIAEHTDKQRGN